MLKKRRGSNLLFFKTVSCLFAKEDKWKRSRLAAGTYSIFGACPLAQGAPKGMKMLGVGIGIGVAVDIGIGLTGSRLRSRKRSRPRHMARRALLSRQRLFSVFAEEICLRCCLAMVSQDGRKEDELCNTEIGPKERYPGGDS